MAEITISLSADTKDAQKQIERYTRRMEQTLTRGADGVEKMNSQWNKMGKAISSLAIGGGALGVLQKGLQTIGKEFEDLKRKRQEALETQISTSQAYARMMENRGSLSVPEARDILNTAQGVPGMTRKRAANMLGDVFSVRGTASVEQTKEAAETAAKFGARTGKDPTPRARALTKWMNVADIESGMGAMGQLLQYKSMSDISEAKKLFQNVPRLGSGIKIPGMNPERMLELSAYFSKAIGDETGERSTTATNKFAQNIMAMDPGTDRSLWEQVQHYQKKMQKWSPERRNEFLQELGGEAEVKSAIRALLMRNPKEWKQVEQIRDTIKPGTSEGAAGKTQSKLREMTDPMAQLRNEMDTMIDKWKRGNKSGAKWELVRESLKRGLEVHEGVSRTEREAILKFFAGKTELLKETPIAAATDLLKKQEKMRRKETRVHRGGPLGMEREYENPQYNPELADALEDLRETLQEHEKILQVNSDAQKENAEATRENTGKEDNQPVEQTGAEPVNN